VARQQASKRGVSCRPAARAKGPVGLKCIGRAAGGLGVCGGGGALQGGAGAGRLAMRVYLAKPPSRNEPCAGRVSRRTSQRRQRNTHPPAARSYSTLDPCANVATVHGATLHKTTNSSDACQSLAALSGHSFKAVKLGPKLICRRDAMWSCGCCDPGVGTFFM